MEESYKYLIAKSDSSMHKWLPLWVHSVDTYHVMQYLLSHWLIDGALFSITKNTSPEDIRKIALFLSIFHDYGKASMTFQAKIAEGIEDLCAIHSKGELCTPSIKDPQLRNCKEMPHGIAGEILLLIKGCPASIAAIVGAHHGRPWEKGPDIADEIEEIINEDEEEIYENFDYGLRLWGGKDRRKTWIEAQDGFYRWAIDWIELFDIRNLTSINDSEAVVLTGLVIMADWLASNENYFPLFGYDQFAPEDMQKRATQAIERISLPPIWRPEFNIDFIALSKTRFGFYPNEIQSNIVEAVITSEEPGIFILEAPMGVGKTEAALLAAEEFSDKRAAGLLFALPTQATANGIFSRIIEWGEGQSEQNVLSIRLAHGMAPMNEKYTDLMKSGKYAECVIDDYEKNGLIVHEFFEGSKQALLADFVVSTVDQVLLASLKQKHFMLRHLGLSGKVVIIDECHAYDTYMNEYLERTLQWLGSYRTPVILLSATLPYERRSALIDAYTGYVDKEKNGKWRKNMGYPLLTWTDRGSIHQKEIKYSGEKRTVAIIRVDGGDTIDKELTTVIALLRDNLMNGGCAAVIVNTVNRAQLIAASVKKALPDKNVLLLHSRYISEDRSNNENLLLAHTGKQSKQSERDGFIVIGTQVIEQSLDFDVDLMITDLCPMDLLLQRIGRLHRHPAHDKCRPEILKKAKCYILGATEELEEGSVTIYGKYVLMRTRAFLPSEISLPMDIAKLVQLVYDQTCSMDMEPEGYEKARKEHERNRFIARKNADAFRLIPPGKERTINRFLEASALADEEQALAQVRNGEKSPELVILFSEGNYLTRDPWRYKDRFEFSICPSPTECRAIANQKLRFPSWTSGIISDSELGMPVEWKKSVWLKRQQLLILDEEGKAEVGDLFIQYDHEFGLRVERRRCERY